MTNKNMVHLSFVTIEKKRNFYGGSQLENPRLTKLYRVLLRLNMLFIWFFHGLFNTPSMANVRQIVMYFSMAVLHELMQKYKLNLSLKSI